MSTPTQTETTPQSTFARLRDLWNDYLPYWFMAPMVVVMVMITFFPGAYDLYLSLIAEPALDVFSAEFVGLRNFETAFTRGGAIHSFVITITVVTCALLLETALGFLLAALVAGVGSNRAKSFYRVLFIIPMAVAPVSLATIGRIMLNSEIGIIPYVINTGTPFAAPNFLSDVPLLTVILLDAWNWTPFMFIIFYAGLSSVPKTLIEASRVDGAPMWRRYVHVIIPYMKPVVFVATLIRLIDLFRTFGVVYGLTGGGPGTATQLVSINIYEQMFINNQINVAAAIAIVYLVLVVALCNVIIAKVGFEGVWD
ncbi:MULTISPECIES: carbohydrate ABC transporter permease [Haloarcula]|uniref:Sugar ABC transporter permease n=2 Tax=Haloarcula TaxID=2237 RepID=A0A2H5A3T1_9EURY|nr:MULTISPECIES: sugar ABC transporter permease [Haloarcula]AUG49406.1 sugar ABC transporter permease [Haloarcula taiwanensis]EMA13233.1 sugar ABC transporter permease protein [Haloarcula californiae ATCC 33799]NHX41004.1 sugar ABC transporter permease [Haloarcula sp. R1-2]RLM32752.1 sugar ABC transporter permease [Haloarcula sp. Atlit-120R]RLM88726.1 sugar ABC transporter permease [Haloarcula sp. Atlit-7R]